jgi:hypothetical protein
MPLCLFQKLRAPALLTVLALASTSATSATITLNTTTSQAEIDTEYSGLIQAKELTGKYASCTMLYEGGVQRGDLQKFHELFGYDVRLIPTACPMAHAFVSTAPVAISMNLW